MSNNATQQLKAANAITELWQGLLPGYEVPDRSQFLTWAAMAPEEVIVHALNRAARKARRQRDMGVQLDNDQLGRYVTGIIANERDGRHRFDGRRAA